MSSARRYRLLCPIARGLDRVGDRWTLLILRDLHAGPARFSDLQSGLTGIATNLLTDRLRQLIDDGLIEQRDGAFGVALYALTDLGGRTGDLLFELAMFGGRFPADEAPRRPGNLRTIVVTLRTAAQRVVAPDLNFTADIIVDDEHFSLSAKDGQVEMGAGAPEAPDVIFQTSYEPMIAVSEGELAMDQFMAEHVSLDVRTAGKDAELLSLLGAAMAVFQEKS